MEFYEGQAEMSQAIPVPSPKQGDASLLHNRRVGKQFQVVALLPKPFILSEHLEATLLSLWDAVGEADSPPCSSGKPPSTIYHLAAPS